jgi:dinuclear metal center YbgI/SA1388 family protein
VASRDEIVGFMDAELDAAGFTDMLPVGLQVTGADVVTKVITGVSASLELFRRAAAAGGQMLIVHHGLFWDRDSRRVGSRERERLRALFDADLSLVAYHLCLDAHPTLGNNAIIARRLGLTDLEPFAEHRGRTLGFIGHARPPIAAPELLARVRREVGGDPLAFMEGPDPVERVGVVSGGAADDFLTAIAAGAGAFVTGEPSEPTLHRAREAGAHFIAAGHYATEVFGVRALGEAVAERFGVEHEFIDLPNPV